MLTRRIAASACALALIVPAAASAVPATDPPAASQQPAVSYGDTKYDLQNAQDLSGPIGDTKNDVQPTTTSAPSAQTNVDRVGSLSAQQLAAAYGTTKPAAPASTSVASDNDNTDGWQIAAWAEAAVLAAVALGSAVLISGRTRSRRLST